MGRSTGAYTPHEKSHGTCYLRWEVPWDPMRCTMKLSESPWNLILDPMGPAWGLPMGLPVRGDKARRRPMGDRGAEGTMGSPVGSPMGTKMRPMGSPMGPITSVGKSHGPSVGVSLGGVKSHGKSHGAYHLGWEVPWAFRRRIPRRCQVPWGIPWEVPCGKLSQSRGEQDASHGTSHGLSWYVMLGTTMHFMRSSVGYDNRFQVLWGVP